MEDLNIIIRPYCPSDKASLVALLKLLTPKYFAQSEIQDYENYLDTEVELYFVMEYTSKIVGAGGINFVEKHTVGRISWDFVHPEMQGKKIGQKLLQYRITLLKSMPAIREITVRTSQLAYLFYQKNGFSLLEIQKDYWAKGYDLYSMKYQHIV